MELRVPGDLAKPRVTTGENPDMSRDITHELCTIVPSQTSVLGPYVMISPDERPFVVNVRVRLTLNLPGKRTLLRCESCLIVMGDRMLRWQYQSRA